MQCQFIKSVRACNTKQLVLHCNDTGVVYIIGLIFVFLTTLFAAGFLLLTSIEHRHVIRDQWSLTALHLAEAGVEDAIWALKNSNWGGGWSTGSEPYTKTVSSFTNSTGTNIGSYDVTVTNPTSIYSYHTATVEATGYSPDKDAGHKIERTIKVSVGVHTTANNGNIESALSTNCDTKITGGLIVDGRDHNQDDPLILTAAAAIIPSIGNGVWGVYKQAGSGTFNPTGSHDIGGTDFDDSDPKDDIAPCNDSSAPFDYEDAICLDGTSYPSTPDDVLNFEPGSLKAIAKSGRNGSQYVTVPTTLTSPLAGVTYVENDWNVGGTFVLNGTGVLVVHNSTTSADLKNLNQGTFKGIIIADDVITFKNNVIGAVVALTSSSSHPTGIVGSGNGRILYSAQAVENAFNDAGGSGSTTVLNWQER